MTDGPEQTSIDAKTAEVQNSAESDLDSLLNEFNDGGDKPTPTPDVSELLKSLKPVVQHAERSMQKEQVDAQKHAVDEAIAAIKQDAAKDIDDDIAHGYLMSQHERNPVFRAAYEGRGADPGAWDKALGEARDGLVEKMGVNTVRSDIEAATAAVKGTSQEEASTDSGEVSVADMFSMSDSEYRTFKETEAAKNE